MSESGGSSAFLPLREAAHCFRCEECFEIGAAACPACGSKACAPFTPVVRARRRSASVYVEEPLSLAA